MRCDTCLLTSAEGDLLPLAEFGQRLSRCDECPIERGEIPCLPETAARLVRRQREAERTLRRQDNKLRQAKNELVELHAEASRSEARVAKLEQVQKANHLQIDQELRTQLDVVRRQRDAILELSMPIIQVSDGILVLPIIGVLDDARAARLTEGLLATLQSRQAHHAILDLTGLSEVNASTANHLMFVVKAAGLLGAEVHLSGMPPQVARTLAELGLGLDRVRAASTLQEALRRCGVGRPTTSG